MLRYSKGYVYKCHIVNIVIRFCNISLERDTSFFNSFLKFLSTAVEELMVDVGMPKGQCKASGLSSIFGKHPTMSYNSGSF